ncbi:amidohydrolase family protein [Terriglobus sp.]|uniref:amidohydrolase family protein n=1 Tax=Terriglobus sp. TaxID=1889013 RepID=UPI003B003A51
MKIICVEEHTSDQDLLKAGQPKLMAEAKYFTEVGSYFNGNVDDGDDKLPQTINFQTSTKLLPDLDGGRLALMDEHGIDMQILSYSNPSQNAPADVQVQLTRQANDRLAEAVRANPSRFGGFACLPWGQPEAAAEELERAVKELGFVGTLLLGRPGDTFLDDARYDPVLAKLNELRVPIYLHPGYPLPQVQQPYYGGLGTEVTARLSLFGWGWHNEAGVHLLRLLLSKKFDQFPNLQVISGHWGEMVPFYLARLDDSIPQR